MPRARRRPGGAQHRRQPTVVGLIGSACSDETVGGIATITNAGLTTISPSATRPALTVPERAVDYAGFLRTAHSDAFQGRAVAEWAMEQGFAKVATIHDGSAYAEALVGVFRTEFQVLGGVVAEPQAVSKQQTDMSTVLTSIAAEAPDAIYFPIFTAEGGFIVDQVRDVAGLEEVVAHRVRRPVLARLRRSRGARRRGHVPLQPELLAVPGHVLRPSRAIPRAHWPGQSAPGVPCPRV